MLIFAKDPLLDAIHEVDSSEITLIDQLMLVLYLPQLPQLGLHQHYLRTSLSQLSSKHVGLGS